MKDVWVFPIGWLPVYRHERLLAENPSPAVDLRDVSPGMRLVLEFTDQPQLELAVTESAQSMPRAKYCQVQFPDSQIVASLTGTRLNPESSLIIGYVLQPGGYPEAIVSDPQFRVDQEKELATTGRTSVLFNEQMQQLDQDTIAAFTEKKIYLLGKRLEIMPNLQSVTVK